MKAWTRPEIPTLPGLSSAPCLYDTASRGLVEAHTGDTARIYVCGITPYDATHMGHAATYLAYDTLQRVWLDAGLEVHFAQNVTDIDDPLLERAAATGVDWQELAASQVDLFRGDMEALSILPPEDYVAVTEVLDEIAEAVGRLLVAGIAYEVPTPESSAGSDIYFDSARAAGLGGWTLGDVSNLDSVAMATLFRERGGDPDRAGKRDVLDPLLWRAARDDEPSWPSSVGAGRPGWHIECSVIALMELGRDFTVQGGGSDLIFPHHEMSAGHAAALSGHPLARVYSHTGMVAYQGEKMSKSLGNLVLVSKLVASGVDARAIRLTLLAHHYRSDWEWTDAALETAVGRLQLWGARFRGMSPTGDLSAENILSELREALRIDLDTPRALAVIDQAAEHGVDDPALVRRAVHALLGVELREL
ncbi:cysteine--1-D-myo-inosityl 2-amino-2-deoxy-alpha-D-glucopyranoside ligase [Mycetocola manganoxydans]|uniref:L-cysteine:1D-myo-inositol 2-amino-2-deoxy-alpha-D-glucopyranoside ligase n=1 Tax=Mycetocola manganoxydans TaxID=699879 RepID=A0A3L6ZXL1_9MICO|nr:cysteine--1-D-myo-inosityl 2-amino-2-deoxy-alpha-D-glucopyranoside ligase [Mycetocola manganoxydans]RLP72445.1 cysteine--1-D-myo-inosityl 2-amino-2-deoxy-alpha-D-glucopyranoside ligase [Mycetocola manganoxydans]GHD40267.1 L-cysteine:1D-myo-inositol 2-amino-2-deoxy-alpha-D-glucopyranoside ligase [Mycetocola manganoxydans]